MSNYARIVDGSAVEVWSDAGLGITPADVFVPTLATQFEPVPDEVCAGWALANGVWTAPPPIPEPAPDWPALIAERRYQAETAGFVWNGYFIATDRESQAKIDTEDRAIDRGLRVDGAGWKCLDLATSQIVFRATTNVEMHDLAASAYRYVRACFDREAELLDAVTTGVITNDMLEQGWPQ